MATVRRTRRFRQPAERVWAVIGRVELLHTWWPGIVNCEMSTDEDGNTVRTVTMSNGIPAPETILELDHLQRHLTYRLSLPIIQYHRCTVDVIELSGDECIVVYLTDCVPNPMALIVGGASGGALEELARQFDAGTGPALIAAGLVAATDEPATAADDDAETAPDTRDDVAANAQG